MITPEQIRKKAENLYPKVLRAWLDGDESFFPKTVPAAKSLDPDDIPAAIESMRRLREHSKEARDFGYRVQWKDRASRSFGKNQFPERIVFETRDDLLRFTGKSREFATFTSAVDRIREKLPQVESWVRSNIRLLMTCESEVDGLIQVVQYFMEHPRPNLFARELPLPVDTKFIERNRRILRAWFDLVLPPHTIRSDESHFERRYGLRYAEPHLLIRLLDPDLAQEVGLPFSELSLPLHTLGNLAIVRPNAFIVENKVNLLTLPPMKSGIALGGLGKAVTDLRYVDWLAHAQINYWGDVDVEGYQILSSLRMIYPQTRSFLMGDDALERWKNLATSGTGFHLQPPPHLTSEERTAFLYCRDENLRIEQERIPQPAVGAAIKQLLDTRSL